MSEDLIIKHCSPTLAGLKTGNMFSCPYQDTPTLFREIRRLNQRLKVKGLCMIPLHISPKRALLYLYRPLRLQKDLSDTFAAEILKKHGYPTTQASACLATLIGKIRHLEDFPHEIGLFLGYPPEDVYGFIENKACKYKCSGCWKVYGDAELAQKRFEQYKKCTKIYCAQWEKGQPLEKLTVAG